MRGKGLHHPFFVFLKNPGFQKTVLFIKNPVFQKTRSFKRPVFSSKTRVFKGSEVLTGQRKTPGFRKNPVFSLHIQKLTYWTGLKCLCVTGESLIFG